jgi:hypothetical protein
MNEAYPKPGFNVITNLYNYGMNAGKEVRAFPINMHSYGSL